MYQKNIILTIITETITYKTKIQIESHSTKQKPHQKYKKKNQIFLIFLIKALSFLNESE